MKKHILYIASEDKIKEAKEDLERFFSSKKPNDHYTITLTKEENLDFTIYFVKKLEDLSTYLRSYPLDIILYDERDRNTCAKEAIKIICFSI